MKRSAFAIRFALTVALSVAAAACAGGPGDESPPTDDSAGVEMVGIGADGQELPVEAVARGVGRNGFPAASMGTSADPWQSIQGPVPDPWHPPPPCASPSSPPSPASNDDSRP